VLNWISDNAPGQSRKNGRPLCDIAQPYNFKEYYMCRYGDYGPYKEPFACFTCRKAFKQVNRWELPKELQPKKGENRLCKCPQCGRPMADMGHDFKAPKQNNIKQWEKVKILFEHGFTYHSCGCCGPGFRPSELIEVADFINDNLSKSEGLKLLNRIDLKIKSRDSKYGHL